MPDIHVPVCSTFASFLGCSHYKQASNYILTFCLYHSESERGQKGKILMNAHGSSHRHFLTFTQFCNTNKTDMPSTEGQWISACRLFQLPNQRFANNEVAGFNTDFAGCYNSYKRHKHPSGRPGRGSNPRNCLGWAGQPPAAAPKVNIVLTVRRTDGTLPSVPVHITGFSQQQISPAKLLLQPKFIRICPKLELH